MYFGEFLIEKNRITHAELINALSEQLEALPSILRVLKDSKILSNEIIVDLIGEQARKDSDLLSILRAKELLTTAQMNEIFSAQAEVRKPIGEILASQGIISADDINGLVDDFLDYRESQNSEPAEVVKSTAGAPEISAAALESLKELESLGVAQREDSTVETKAPNDLEFDFNKQLSDIFVGQYLSAFSEGGKNKIFKIIEMMKDNAANDGDTANIVNSLYREVHILMGAANLAEVQVAEMLLTKLDKVSAGLFKMGNDDLSIWVNTNISTLSEAFEIVWLARESLQLNSNEKIFWNNASLKERYLKSVTDLDFLNKEN